MTVSAVKVGAALLVMVGVLHAASRGVDRAPLDPEVRRKLVHMCVGLCTLTFPYVFGSAAEVVALCALAVGVLLAARHLPWLRARLGAGLHSVRRSSYGDIHFVFSVMLVFKLAEGNPVLFVLPMLILTLCDAAAALVGVIYAKTAFETSGDTKSWEGTLVFFVTAWLLSLVSLLLLGDIDGREAVLISLVLAMFGTLVEAISWDGLDNLFVPITLFLLVEMALEGSPVGVPVAGGALAALLAGAAVYCRVSGRRLHPGLVAVTGVFFFWVAGGWANVAAPTAVLAAHLWIGAREGDGDRGLEAAFSLICTSLCWLTIAAFLDYNTRYVFNLSMAVHMSLMLLLSSRRDSAAFLSLVLAVSWLVGILHFPAMPDLTAGDLALRAAWTLAILAPWVVVAARFRQAFRSGRWLKQGLAAVCLSILGVPATL